MSESPKGLLNPAEGEGNLLAAYTAACNRHQQIDEFRGKLKLLALLPIASGATGLLLIGEHSTFGRYLTPIGIYGFIATFGLFMFIYELYGICVCKQIMQQAGELETRLRVPESMGQYRDRKTNTPRQRLVQAEMASWVVYLSVLAGWAYIAGAHSWWDTGWPWWIAVILLILATRGAAIAVPKWYWNLRRKPTAQSSGELTRRDNVTTD